MTDHLLMNIALVLTCIVLFGMIVVSIANRLLAPPQEYIVRRTPQTPQTPQTTDGTWASSRGCNCDCDCDDDEDTSVDDDLRLLNHFTCLRGDSDEDVRNAAKAATLRILRDYGSEEG